jgi:hypothetical protein
VAAGGEAQVGDRLPRSLLPVWVELAGALVEEDLARRVPLLAWERTEVDPERRREPVPREDVHPPSEDHGRDAVECVEQAPDLRPDALGLWRAAPAGGGAGEVVQVRELVVVEAEGLRDRLQDLVRRLAGAALLEADVLVDADAGELGELLSAQAGHPAPPVRG